MVVDSIDWNDGRVTIRGGLRETSERASLLLGSYVDKLRDDPEIGPNFSSITVTGLNRSTEDEQMLGYEISLKLKPRIP